MLVSGLREMCEGSNRKSSVNILLQQFNVGGDLRKNYEYGIFTWYPTPDTPDFQRVFPVQDPYEIMFVTGDAYAWAITGYAKLRTLIDDRGSDFQPNISFLTSIDGVVLHTEGNVLSRPGVSEDPWISIDGSHISAINNGRIVWGEADWDESQSQLSLKNLHGGINVYIREFTAVSDEESTFPCHLLSSQYDPSVEDRTGSENNSIIQHPLLPSGNVHDGESNITTPTQPSLASPKASENTIGKNSVIGIVLAGILVSGLAVGMFVSRLARGKLAIGRNATESFTGASKDFPEGCIRLKSKS